MLAVLLFALLTGTSVAAKEFAKAPCSELSLTALPINIKRTMFWVMEPVGRYCPQATV